MVRTVKKPEERRSDIVKAARTLFQSRDYDKTTMQDVMDSLGIAKGTIYYYFPSKEALLEAVVNDIVDETVTQMQRVVDEASGNAIDKIRTLIAAGNATENGPEVAEILEQLHRPGNLALHIRTLAVAIEKQAPLYAAIIRQGCQEGLFHTDAPLEAAEFILTSVQFLTDTGISPWTPKILFRRASAFPAIIEALLKAPSGSFQFLSPETLDPGETK